MLKNMGGRIEVKKVPDLKGTLSRMDKGQYVELKVEDEQTARVTASQLNNHFKKLGASNYYKARKVIIVERVK